HRRFNALLTEPTSAHSSFFFQAEDGIRDFHVTGVQTCALPICLLALYCRITGAELHLLFVDATPAEARRGQDMRGRRVSERSFRSEERRVGQAGSSPRWTNPDRNTKRSDGCRRRRSSQKNVVRG